jgi:hypothetical protein
MQLSFITPIWLYSTPVEFRKQIDGLVMLVAEHLARQPSSNEPDPLATTNSYLYCMRGGPPDRSVVLNDYNAHKHKQFVDDWFADFTAYVHRDADPFF